MRFYIKTLGCKMNQLDSARVRAALSQAGFDPVDSEQQADYVLVNSCTVTAHSDRKSRRAVNSALKENREVAVMGCSVRANQQEWQQRFPAIDLFPSQDELLDHLGIYDQEVPFPITSRTRLPVAIQNGCDDTCSFCITRFARGPHTSYDAAKIIEHINDAYDKGVREVVLTGINLAAWGSANSKTQPRQNRLAELLQDLLDKTAMPRIRLSSLGPQYLDDDFFSVFADARICDHLHLSIQSGSPSVLARMQRGHDDEDVYRVTEQARQVRPQVALTTDFIVGFPGETDSEARQTLDMVNSIGFAKLHVFPFSPRQGTEAATMPAQLDNTIKKARAAELRQAGHRLRQAFIRSQLGRELSILLEHDHSGLTGNYIRLHHAAGKEGEIVTLKVTEETIADRF